MGNFCCETRYSNDLSYIDSLGSFIKCLLENLTRVQGEITSCSPSQRGDNKLDYNETVLKNTSSKNYSRYQYYIVLNNVLIKMKILAEDYFFIKKGYQIADKDEKEQKVTIGMNTIDLKEQDFDLEKAKVYLGKVLDTEDGIQTAKLEELNNQLVKNFFSGV